MQIIRASNTSGDPGLIDEQCLRRSRENDKHMFLNQVSGCNNKEQPQSAKNKYEQVGQGSSDVPNNLLPMENNADVVLNQDQADEIISTDEEVLHNQHSRQNRHNRYNHHKRRHQHKIVVDNKKRTPLITS